ncbi:APC family permease [Flagellimonas zhangzhouensis]|uniref:Amino acid transporter n=1 Tax=Flagellimonas zhangzhouensis TaxID=1073328 RepID=A0A1H2SC87_9FLAO|nr:APC family permease [Allomuricauda zhangzhouensis]SDQ73144.1 amino acid/polyamine/organocation transporter, APC superfamily [Allomuricauda zhangzhouensis]SDW29127.1 Amino acid transporter [Allomuricauda zhangzhouensis]
MEPQKLRAKLGELASTSISGNDISSSCLYVSALAVIHAGQYAWISLLIVGVVLFLFRKIYGEVVGALPMNGGAYNALLNTTSKGMASLAAALTLLSYMATAVISANEAMAYLKNIVPHLPVIMATIGLLAVFMGLVIIGIGESSKVAIGIFIFHLSSLVLLSSFAGFYLFENGLKVFMENNALPVKHGALPMALFFGFSAAMLGISGFESSANFVEEQKKGVFPKTLRNMWVVVTIFNPLIAFLALAVLPISEIESNSEALLSIMGNQVSGSWLAFLVSIDAVLVLSGAVLTSFVGVSGLVERITLDRILPPFLLKRNKNGSTYRIAIVFFMLCVSILLITEGNLEALAGVYTIAFLSVMALFGIGNILLKVRRKHLPRPERSGWISLLIAILAVITALIGNIILNPDYLAVFMEYFIPTIALVLVMLNRTALLKLLLRLIRYFLDPVNRFLVKSYQSINKTIDKINDQEFVYFTKKDDVAALNKVLLYIRNNEHTRKLKIVSVFPEGEQATQSFVSDLNVLDREYPEIKVDYIQLHGEFTPQLIKKLSEEWNIPINFMFIGSPSDKFPYPLQELGGVRLII